MIELTASETGFLLSYRGKAILRHATSAPCIRLGRGAASYRMRHSSFAIKDASVREVVPSGFAVRDAQRDRVEIVFVGALTMLCIVVDGALDLRFTEAAPGINRLWLSVDASPTEHIYGGGEQFSVLDLRGRLFPVWIQEQGVGRGNDLITLLANLHSGSGGTWHTTYFAQPTFVSSANYSCHIDTTAYAELDFRDKARHILHTWEIPARIRIDVQNRATAVIERLSAFLGRQPALPAWAYDGLWLGVQGGTQVTRQKLDTALAYGVAVTALWAQDWEGIRMTSFGKQLMWNWRHDDTLYPDLRGYIAELRERGIRFLGYINPMLALEGEQYREARQEGYLVKDRAGREVHVQITTFPAALVDLENPAAVAWYKRIIKEQMIELGMSGWMADFGEALPADAVMHSGRSGELAHNDYPVLWAKLNREAVEESGKLGEIAFFMRAGSTGSSRHALACWAGDQLANWSMHDGLATVIPAALSLGFCGIGHMHSDIGGYTAVAWIKRSKEVFLRWCEHAAFTPIMRTHEGNRPDTSWQFDSDAETLSHLARMVRVYVHLKEYHRQLGREYVDTGLPPMRHPYLHYEGDETLHRLQYQYLYGRDLLVAPVYRPGKRAMGVYLPDDAWVHAWTGRAYRGGWHLVPAPIGQPPVFYRAASAHEKRFRELRDIR